jgi:hypothetical protein
VFSLVLESSTPQADFQFGGSDWALWHSTELCLADGCCTGGIPVGLVEFDLLRLVGGGHVMKAHAWLHCGGDLGIVGPPCRRAGRDGLVVW